MMLLRQHPPRFIVVYSDGNRSVQLDRSVARNYADIFGGKVVCVRPKKSLIEKLIRKLMRL